MPGTRVVKKRSEAEKAGGPSIIFDNLHLDGGLRLDMLVESCAVVEIKAVQPLLAVRCAQVLTYLKLSGRRLGFLINFNVTVIKGGVKRLIL